MLSRIALAVDWHYYRWLCDCSRSFWVRYKSTDWML